jgi:hypothetical protein
MFYRVDVMKIIYKKSIAGCELNEDYVFGDESIGYIIDGLANLSELKYNSRWYVTNFANFFNNNQSNDILNDIKNTVSSMRNKVKNQGFTNNYEIPCAEISLVKDCGDFLEICQIGDLPIIILKNDGTYKVLYGDKSLIKEKRKLLREIEKDVEINHINVKDAIENKRDLRKNIRNKKNTPHNYTLLDINTNVLNNIEIIRLSKLNIKKIFIMSSGFMEIFETMKIFTLDETIKMLDEENYNQLFLDLKQSQVEDPEISHLRLSISDDATLLAIEI